MLNEVTLIGNLGNDPEVVELASGKIIANLNLATTEKKYNQKSNKYNSYTEWHKITVFDQNAIFSRKLKKGFMIYVKGKLQTRNWIDSNKNRRTATEVVGFNLKNLTHVTTQEYIKTKSQQDSNNIQDVVGSDDVT